MPRTTARYNVYSGEGRDAYDVRGRSAHESIFNVNDGSYRCPNSQQGYSPFSTWTRGLAWIMCGYAEQLEFLSRLPESEFAGQGGKRQVLGRSRKWPPPSAISGSNRHATDGIPYWDTGAPDLHRLGDWADRPADPFNAHEPVDSSAAAIAAQGLLRYGNYLRRNKPRTDWGTVLPGGLDHRQQSVSRSVSVSRPETPGTDFALGLSSSQRLGPHSGRTKNSVRRIVDVGRLSCARIGADDLARSKGLPYYTSLPPIKIHVHKFMPPFKFIRIPSLKTAEAFGEYVRSLQPLTCGLSHRCPWATPRPCGAASSEGQDHRQSLGGSPDGRMGRHDHRRGNRADAAGAGGASVKAARRSIWGGEAMAVRPDGRANPNQLIINGAKQGGHRAGCGSPCSRPSRADTVARTI